MIIKENDKMVSVHFDNMLELMDFKPENPKNKREFNSYIKSENDYPGRGWIGNAKNYKEIVDMALLGDKRTYKTALNRMAMLNDGDVSTASQHIQKVKRIKIKSDMGDELDIHKVYQGNLSHAWGKTQRIEIDVKHHLVTLFLSINGSCGVKFNDTIWRCSLILKLAKEIQLAGKSVKIIVGGMVNRALIGSSKRLTISITVKKYNETLSPERLAAMTNIGFYRVFGFAAKHCQDRDVSSSGGSSVTVTKYDMPIHLQEEVDKGHTKPIFLSGVESEYEAKNEIKWAFRQMKELQ